ncbi:prolipoprotein diacylglyceryl transferase [Fodinibius salsisoli]|uniref:Phosphatidylglycerol--prolipoprotein diacylglyceryl transferase n=1 Tax=Fodinibius salsisoli TaxID=2820877 RepID=A0ABT3PS07_9BACT|nr:prolipoprotein diacylglyceryl transferase [Fodinibius salsisoli]MCW9708655.1 prolipoprotein diacylglyceryl transferase [Fodinibius salsisoli]
MQASDYLVWSADPIAFSIGPIDLPFPLAIWGLVAAAVLIYFGYQKLVPEDLPAGKEPEIPAWKLWGMVIGSFIIGQLIFLLLPSPTINEIGPIAPRWYGFLFASAFAVGFILTRKMFEHASRDPLEVDQLFLYVMLATIIGARLGHVLFYDPSYYLRHPGEIIAIWHGGLASHGAAIGILIAMYLFARKQANMSFLWVADRVVVVVAIAGAFIRTGNFVNSEIIGQPTELPWGVIFEKAPGLTSIERTVPRHPTMLYEALLCIAIFALLWVIYKRYRNRPPEGALFGTFLALLFGGRFFLEFTKINQAAFAGTWAINMGQWLSVPLILVGIWLLAKKVNWNKTEASSQP